MAQRSKTPGKSGDAVDIAIKKQPSARRDSRPRQSAEKRLSAIFDALTEELLTTLEHYYDRKEK